MSKLERMKKAVWEVANKYSELYENENEITASVAKKIADRARKEGETAIADSFDNIFIRLTKGNNN